MSEAVSTFSIHDLLTRARERLDRSLAIARCAERCAEDGDTEKAVAILLGIEPQLYEATSFINAASLLNRISGD